MRKFYEDPDVEVIEFDALIATLNNSGELDDFGDGDGDDIGDLLDD